MTSGGFGPINLASLLANSVQHHADLPAFICDQRRISYRQLGRAVRSAALALRKFNIQKGDKVALMLPNCPEFVYYYFAIVQSGAIAVVFNTASTPYEMHHLLNNSDARVLVTFKNFEKKYQEIADSLSTCKDLYLLDPDERLETKGEPEFSDHFATPVDIDPNDPAVMIYTAGLTGKPLGAVLTHRNLCSQADMIQTVIQRKPGDVGLSLIPLFHTFGATVNMLNVIRAGCATVMMDRLTLDSLFAAIEREKITYIAAVPRLFIAMIFYDKADKYDVSSLNLCATGGAPMPADFIPVFEKKFGIRLLEGYGLTEAAPACSFNRLEQVAKPGSIGTPLPGIKIKIVDDEGREVPRNTVGELIIHGDNIMKEYYKDPVATANVLRDDWLYTGDLGRMDEENYIFLTGLKKRMIISSGFNVYPKEVETIIDMHPAVSASRVTGKEDLMRGELVRAEVMLKPGSSADEKEIIRHCKIYLSPYKVPREVEFVSTMS